MIIKGFSSAQKTLAMHFFTYIISNV